MFRYAKNVRLASLRLSLALSGSYWIFPCLSLALHGSLWLPLWLSLALTATLWHTLTLSGSLLLSNFAYTVLDRLSGPLLGSQRRCHADTLSPALLISYMLLNITQWRQLIFLAMIKHNQQKLYLWYIATWFLAVQDSFIGDLFSHSVSEPVSQWHFSFQHLQGTAGLS